MSTVRNREEFRRIFANIQFSPIVNYDNIQVTGTHVHFNDDGDMIENSTDARIPNIPRILPVPLPMPPLQRAEPLPDNFERYMLEDTEDSADGEIAEEGTVPMDNDELPQEDDIQSVPQVQIAESPLAIPEPVQEVLAETVPIISTIKPARPRRECVGRKIVRWGFDE